jgi:arylsulfatase A-like enzyme
MALWFGMIGGLIEMAVVLARTALFGASALGHLQLNQDGIGLIPVADTLIVAVGGLPLVLLALFRRHGDLDRVAIAVLSFLAWFSVLQPLRGLSTTAHALLALGLAAFSSRRLWARLSGLRRAIRLSVGPLGAAVIVAAGAPPLMGIWSERQAMGGLPPAPKGAPNALFVVLDTVRADALSSYGYERRTTPNLDRLAARGVRFAHARAAGAWTLPSHASMFTGRWPHELSARFEVPLDETYPTLAEYLSDRGYETAGFIANTWFCNPWYGLARGFLHYEATPGGFRTLLQCSGLGRRLSKHLGRPRNERLSANMPRKDAETVNREFLNWLQNRAQPDRPFFAFLNYFDVHDPYLLCREPDQSFGLRPESPVDHRLLRDWLEVDKAKLSTRDVRLARDGYDDCLAYLDAEFGRMLNVLERRGVLNNTWIIVTADHGEQFGEHGRYLHGNSLYLENFHVPLLIVPPRHAEPSGRVIPQAVSLRDLAATVVDLLGMKEGSPFPGRSLARTWETAERDDSSIEPPVVYEIVDQPPKLLGDWLPPRAVESQGWIYLQKGNGAEELYALDADPRQTRNLVGDEEHAPTLERFRRFLSQRRKEEARGDAGNHQWERAFLSDR